MDESHPIHQMTYVVEHNPNCPSPFLVRLPGLSLVIDKKPYVSAEADRLTSDALGFGKTFLDAADKAIEESERIKKRLFSS